MITRDRIVLGSYIVMAVLVITLGYVALAGETWLTATILRICVGCAFVLLVATLIHKTDKP